MSLEKFFCNCSCCFLCLQLHSVLQKYVVRDLEAAAMYWSVHCFRPLQAYIFMSYFTICIYCLFLLNLLLSASSLTSCCFLILLPKPSTVLLSCHQNCIGEEKSLNLKLTRSVPSLISIRQSCLFLALSCVWSESLKCEITRSKVSSKAGKITIYQYLGHFWEWKWQRSYSSPGQSNYRLS